MQVSAFMVPVDVLSDLRPAERATAADARHACGITDRIWDAELRHHLMVREIVHGADRQRRGR
jgi:hypothetical protein